MWANFGKNIAQISAKITSSVPVPATSSVRLDSGIGGVQVKNLEIGRQERIEEILSKVRHRHGLPKIPSHVEHLVGRVTGSVGDMPGLDLGDKTQLILQSNHPVRHTLEREIYNHSKQIVSYYDWLILFGRGIRTSDNPKYEEILNFISRASDSGMFSSEIHQTVIDIPEDYNTSHSNLLSQYSLGNKYATLVGDYFAIRCIYYMEKAKNSKAFIAITKGLEQFTMASFAVKFLDPKIIYPHLPHSRASLDEWIRYNRKVSGYFTGGLYAALVANYDGLPKDVKTMEAMKRFSSNLAVLLKGVGDIETLENAHEFSSLPTSLLTTLPAVLHQQKHPGAFDSLRHKEMNFNTDFKQIAQEIERSSAIHEAKFILGEISLEARRNYEEIAKDGFYGDVVLDLVDAIANFD